MWECVVPLSAVLNVVALVSMVSLAGRDSVTLKYGYHGVRATTLIFVLMQKCNVLRHPRLYSRVELPFFCVYKLWIPRQGDNLDVFGVIKVLLGIAACSASWSKSSGLKANSAFGFPSFEDLFGCIFPNVARVWLLSSPRRSSDSGRYGLFSGEGCNPRGFGDVGWSGIKKSDPFKPKESGCFLLMD